MKYLGWVSCFALQYALEKNNGVELVIEFIKDNLSRYKNEELIWIRRVLSEYGDELNDLKDSINEKLDKDCLYNINYNYRSSTLKYKDTYNGYTFYICSSPYGIPECFIKLKENDTNIPLGVSYNKDYLVYNDNIHLGKFIGWDHANHGDYTVFLPGGKKYSLSQLINECRYKIDQIINYE